MYQVKKPHRTTFCRLLSRTLFVCTRSTVTYTKAVDTCASTNKRVQFSRVVNNYTCMCHRPRCSSPFQNDKKERLGGTHITGFIHVALHFRLANGLRGKGLLFPVIRPTHAPAYYCDNNSGYLCETWFARDAVVDVGTTRGN